MSFNHSPNIVRNGLVLCLDAKDLKSYSGSGTTWVDRSGNGNNGTLVNGVSYSNGAMVFDGVDDYVSLPSNFFIHDSGSPFTFSIWFKANSSGILFGQQSSSTPNTGGGWVPAIYIDTNGKLVISCFWGGSTTNVSTSDNSVINSNWNNITVTFSSNLQRSYLNGILFSTISKTQTTYSSIYYYFLGTGRCASWPNAPTPYLNGNISTFLHYNRALSQAEILQNFNAQKGRYGI